MKNHENHLPPPVPASGPTGPVQPRRGRPNVALGLVAAAGIAVGVVGGLFIPSPAAEAETATVTPDSCIEAIALADEALTVSASAMGTIADAFGALSEGNILLADIIMSDLDSDTEKITGMQDAYHAAKADCQGSHGQ